MPNDLLTQLTHDARLWQAGQWRDYQCAAIATEYPALDALLAGQGWPLGGLTELLCDTPGIGELRLLMPALARLSQQPRWQLWITPPFVPFAPALQAHGIQLDRVLIIHARQTKAQLWTAEQALRSGCLVLCWPGRLNTAELRRLQLAAKAGDSCGFLFRSSRAAQEHSPAVLRIKLQPHRDGLHLQLLKRRGGWPVDALIPLHALASTGHPSTLPQASVIQGPWPPPAVSPTH
ncbi:MAG: translesion DNA synthesis-associated protein ImuA [Hahellaceae bacterium]|nr:translesion DNA synthesis-associated protein ImuA [Hahellaceae bacterium]MCP5169695.1 translesion DNA synthesis-associated protein ImuA [Hahellaceae bacterium]